VSKKINKRDLPWVALLGVSFAFGLAVSWERWGNPLVDCGREMNQPLRLSNGEMLYSDVRHIYGPISPYLNAGLYDLFDPSLNVLYANGIVTALIIIALVYWLGRQLMGRAAATAATLSVMWICAFKQAGNYILPYSYAALHGCALGLATLALTVKWLLDVKSGDRATSGGRQGPERASSTLWLVIAGIVAGATVLAKTEMGFAAVATGIIATILAHHQQPGRALWFASLFGGAALLVVGSVYGLIAMKVGWSTLLNESFLSLQNLPPELVYFNKRMSGADQPWLSFAQMISAAIRVAGLALFMACLTLLVERHKSPRRNEKLAVSEREVPDAGRISYSLLWVLLTLSVLIFLFAPTAGNLQWDKGPYLAMPVLLLSLLVWMLLRYHKQTKAKDPSAAHTLVLSVTSVFALLSLARVILRVRSGGAYSSYLLPASVILFTFCWTQVFPMFIRNRRARPIARTLVLSLIFTWVTTTAGVVAHRYRTNNTYPITTPKGRIIAIPELGIAFDEAIRFINEETQPDDAVAVLPEGTSLNFFTDRPNPLREEITTPGYLNPADETRAIEQLSEADTRWVLLANRATPEFGKPIFGRDYCQTLMGWIEKNFEQRAIFGPDHDPDLQIGGRTFFIRAYERKKTPLSL
jgi:4-amino-4-deoxy-L-arabinose transferase-like glycosyltransferase